MKGKVQTVLGEIDPSFLGHVLPHEHFEANIESVFYQEPLINPHLKESEYVLENLGWIRQFPYSHLSNMCFQGPVVRQALHNDLKRFKEAKGGTVVDNTSIGTRLPNCANVLKELSQKTGVHIVAGTGFYIAPGQSETTMALSEEAMVDFMTERITEGCVEDRTVKSGIIGEIGCSYPLDDFEKRSLRASGEVEEALGCPVMVHPGRDPSSPEEALRIYAEAGGNPSRLVMAHLERTLQSSESLIEFASLGTYLEFDLFGIETSYYQHNEMISMPSDGQRIDSIEILLQEGYKDRILISHDIHTKHRMTDFGGHGFAHIPTVVVPIMLKRGISQELIDSIIIHNPATWLTFVK